MFDERWLRSADPIRSPLSYEGFELVDYFDFFSRHYRRWSFDGRYVRELAGNSIQWEFENDLLRRIEPGAAAEWTFDGRTLRQLANQPDVWESDADVPLLVILFTAGLL